NPAGHLAPCPDTLGLECARMRFADADGRDTHRIAQRAYLSNLVRLARHRAWEWLTGGELLSPAGELLDRPSQLDREPPSHCQCQCSEHDREQECQPGQRRSEPLTEEAPAPREYQRTRQL